MKKIRIATAIIVAIGSCILSPRESWGRITGTIALLWNIARKKTHLASADVLKRRLDACEKCPLFYPRLRTCGTPLVKDLRGLGCYCNMDLKAQIKEAGCWGDDNLNSDFSFGWQKDDTNGTV